MPTQRKIDTVADLSDKLSRTQLTVVADYRGLSVAEISDLRKRLRETGATEIVSTDSVTHPTNAIVLTALLADALQAETRGR